VWLTLSIIYVKLTSAIFLRNKLQLLEFLLGKSLSPYAKGLAVKGNPVKESRSERQSFQRQDFQTQDFQTQESARQVVSEKPPDFERLSFERQIVLKDNWTGFSLP
jgi:hypothetical protein